MTDTKADSNIAIEDNRLTAESIANSNAFTATAIEDDRLSAASRSTTNSETDSSNDAVEDGRRSATSITDSKSDSVVAALKKEDDDAVPEYETVEITSSEVKITTDEDEDVTASEYEDVDNSKLQNGTTTNNGYYTNPADLQDKTSNNEHEYDAVYAEISHTPQSPKYANVQTTYESVSKEGDKPTVNLDTLPPTMDYRAYLPKENDAAIHNQHTRTCKLVKSFEGLLFFGEIVGSLLCWILLVVWSYGGISINQNRIPPMLGFSMIVFVASFVFSTILFIILLTGSDEKFQWLSISKKPLFAIPYNLWWGLLYAIAGGLEASFAVKDLTQILGASTAFAFILLIFHSAHALIYFHRRYGKCPWSYLPHAECEVKISS